MEIVINNCYGGFSLSAEALEMYKQFKRDKNIPVDEDLYDDDIPRNDPDLIRVVKLFGSNAGAGVYTDLKIVEIPDDVDWEINERDGNEWVAEKHRRWC